MRYSNVTFTSPPKVLNRKSPYPVLHPQKDEYYRNCKTISPSIKRWLIDNPNCTTEVTIDIEKQTVTTVYTGVIISTVETYIPPLSTP